MKKVRANSIKSKLSNRPEYWEQVEFTLYLEQLKKKGVIKVFSAVPNNTWTTSWKQKTKQKAEGVRSGVPDMIIVTHTDVIFVEMKRKNGGIVSESQKEWIEALELTGKVKVKVAHGCDEAKNFINNITK